MDYQAYVAMFNWRKNETYSKEKCSLGSDQLAVPFFYAAADFNGQDAHAKSTGAHALF